MSESAPAASRRRGDRPPAGRGTSSVVASVVAAAGWWTLLGWDTEKTRGSDGYLHGPYDAWQVIGLVTVLALLGVWLGRRGVVRSGPAAAAVTLAVCFGISAELDPMDDGLWPVGAILLLAASFTGVALAARGTRSVRRPSSGRPLV